MFDVEKIICSLVESDEMRLHLIGQLEGMSQGCIKDLIMNARCSMEKKHEFLKLLEKNNDYYSTYVDFTEEALKNFYSGLKEDVTILGYNTGLHTKETSICTNWYIQREFDDLELRLLIDSLLFYTVDVLGEAVAKKKKVRFVYN